MIGISRCCLGFILKNLDELKRKFHAAQFEENV